jgi:Flp pilus assembly protein TadG
MRREYYKSLFSGDYYIVINFHATRVRRSLRRDDGGATAVEFALVAPILFFSLLSLVEIGVLGMMSAGLENAVDDAARRLRTGREDSATSSSDFESQVCARFANSSAECRDRLVVSVQRFTRFSDANATNQAAPDGSFNKGGAGDIIIVKANYAWPLMTPFLLTAFERSGPFEVTLASRHVFKNEPFE